MEKSSWKPEWQFDFSVHLSTHMVSAIPGQSIEVSAIVELIRGEPQPVTLSVSPTWVSSGLIAQIIPSIATPGAIAMLHIVVSANAPPGSYPFAVRGETQGTFKTSEDMVTVVVEASPKSREKSSDQQTNESAKTTMKPPQLAKARPGSSGKSAPKGRKTGGNVMRGFLAIIIIAAVIAGLLYISNNISHNNNNLTTTNSSPSINNYVGTQTFTIYSTLGGTPESSTGSASIRIDSNGDVLGPVLFGKIVNGVFTGQAQTQDGQVTPMTGTLSDGNFQAHYQSSSHSWTWNLHKQ